MGLGGGGEREGLACVVQHDPADRRVRDDLQVNAVKCRDVLLHGEQFECAGARGGTEALTALGVAQQRHARLRERLRVARRDDEPRAADDLHDRADVGGHGGPAAEHGLDEADREALDDAGQDGDRARGVCVGEGRHLGTAELLEGDGVVTDGVQSLRLVREELRGQRLAVPQIGRALVAGGRADDPQPRLGLLLADLREGVEEEIRSLAGSTRPTQTSLSGSPHSADSPTSAKRAASMPG